MIEHWEQVPIFGDRIKQRVREGREEGREEGLALVRENISEFLHVRFGMTNGTIARAIQAIDEPKKLRAVFRRILTADSPEAIKKALAVKKLSRKRSMRIRTKQ